MTKSPTKRFAAVAMARQIGKLAALGAMYGSGGPGSPVSLMTGHLVASVRKYRQVKPFPLPIDDFLASCYPPQLFDPHSENDARWINLAKALNVEPVVHFHVEGRDETNETFWVRGSKEMPAPSDLSMTLLYSGMNPHFGKVNAWVTEALLVHEHVEDSLEYLRVFIQTVKHPTHVKSFWPELLPFIGEMPESIMKHQEAVVRRTISLPTKERRDKITDLLATCSLLTPVELAAWVKFPERVS